MNKQPKAKIAERGKDGSVGDESANDPREHGAAEDVALNAVPNLTTKPMEALIMTKEDVNALRFALFNLNSPSKDEAMVIIEEWKTKLTLAARKMHPLSTPTVNVD